MSSEDCSFDFCGTVALGPEAQNTTCPSRLTQNDRDRYASTSTSRNTVQFIPPPPPEPGHCHQENEEPDYSCKRIHAAPMDPAARSFRFNCRPWLGYFDRWGWPSATRMTIHHFVSVVVVVVMQQRGLSGTLRNAMTGPNSVGYKITSPGHFVAHAEVARR